MSLSAGNLKIEAIERTLADESIITSLYEEIQRGPQIFADECYIPEDALNSVYALNTFMSSNPSHIIGALTGGSRPGKILLLSHTPRGG